MGRFEQALFESYSIPTGEAVRLAKRFASEQSGKETIELAKSFIRRDDYDISDLFEEIAGLRAAISSGAPLETSARALSLLDEIFSETLRATARVQELALEESLRGYAELDGAGRILHHNKALALLLGDDMPVGKNLTRWFGQDAEVAGKVLEEVLAAPERRRRQLRIAVKPAVGKKSAPVIAEFCAIPGGGEVAAFALFHEISNLVDAEIEAYDHADFAVLRVNRNLTISYCNPKAARVLNWPIEDLVGRSIKDFVEEKSLGVLRAEYDKRDRGRASRYVIELRDCNGWIQKIEVTALPEFDMDGDQRLSTLAFLRNIGIQETRERLRDEIESARRPHDLLRAASQVLQARLPHDMMVFTIYQSDGGWAWPIHIEPQPIPHWQTRWFEISSEVKSKIDEAYEKSGGLVVDNIEAFISPFDESDPLKKDPTIPRLLEEGMRSSITIFIKENKQYAASISFLRRAKGAFQERDIRTLMKLGIENLLRESRRAFEQRESGFFDELVDKIQELTHEVDGTLSSEQVLRLHRKLASLITEKLSRFYRWRYVSIFQCDAARAKARLLSAYDFRDGHREEYEDYEIGYDAGMVGLAIRQARAVVMHDCEADSKEARAFVRVNPDTRAALCVPLKVQGRVIWVLNIEDDRVGAFGERDKEILATFINNVQVSLENLFVEGVLERIISESLDAILVVDGAGVILRTNAPARAVLGANEHRIVGRPISRFISRPEVSAILEKATHLNQYRCEVAGGDGVVRNTLLTLRTLPECFGLRVIYLADLDQLTWKHDMKAIGGVISRAAAEVSEPIATVDWIIGELARPDAEGKEDLLRIAREKLNGMTLTYRRVAASFPVLGGAGEQKLHDCRDVLHGVIGELSIYQPAAKWIELSDSPERLPVLAERKRIEFVFQSILEYLRRRKADAERIRVDLANVDGMAVASFGCRIGEEQPEPADSLGRADRSGRRLVSLGEPGIRRIVENEHRGSVTISRNGDGLATFVVGLPLASVERRENRKVVYHV